MLAEAARHDLRTVTWSRPGYAGSTRLEGRTVADVATDVETVLDALDADRCFVIGWSGGGPHALATAALLPQRVMGAATIASVAPFEAEGLDWLAGMGLENVDEFSAVVEGPEKLRTYLEGFAGALAGITASDVADSLGDLIPAVDRSALTGEFAEAMAASLRASVSSGIDGWLDDDLAFIRPWGFELDTIRVPLTVWQGRAGSDGAVQPWAVAGEPHPRRPGSPSPRARTSVAGGRRIRADPRRTCSPRPLTADAVDRPDGPAYSTASWQTRRRRRSSSSSRARRCGSRVVSTRR